MKIFIIDLEFICWWNLELWRMAINWRSGLSTYMEYGEVSRVNFRFQQFEPWKVLESVREIYNGPIVIGEPIWRSTGS